MTESRPARIALINDDTAFLDLMHELLQQVEGYDVLICKESNDAYGFVKREQPDLVLLDIRMGGEERGWTILELLTLDPSTRTIPVIVCSAAIRQLQDHQPTLEQLGNDVLPKPFDLDVLLEKISVGLARGRNRKG
jgi:DNA-binding response OmpR family regulator